MLRCTTSTLYIHCHLIIVWMNYVYPGTVLHYTTVLLYCHCTGLFSHSTLYSHSVLHSITIVLQQYTAIAILLYLVYLEKVLHNTLSVLSPYYSVLLVHYNHHHGILIKLLMFHIGVVTILHYTTVLCPLAMLSLCYGILLLYYQLLLYKLLLEYTLRMLSLYHPHATVYSS